MPFIPHTPDDLQKMLEVIGISDIEELFDEVPNTLPRAQLQHIPAGMSELEVTRLMTDRARGFAAGTCFLGAGAYEHHIPAAVWDIVGRGEFYTAYTPYQAEASQGTLQLIYEYQTMMAKLMAMDLSNASLYDGATALAEAVLMSIRLQHKDAKKILIPRTVHPHYRKVLRAIVQQQEIVMEEIPYTEHGTTDIEALKKINWEDVSALVIPQPNFLGVLEDVDALTNFAHEKNSLAIALVNPIAMALLKPPGSWGNRGADIACGEGQPLGIPLSSGGPNFGFLCCKKNEVRQMPGRIVGRTHDHQGRTGFVLTLQAREQHIRRAKATSNICTNQGLMVTAATIYLSLLGARGLKSVAAVSHQNARLLLNRLSAVHGVKSVFSTPFFHEFVISFSVPVDQVLERMSDYGIQAGYSLKADYPELGEALLVCATETKTAHDIERYQKLLETCLKR